MTSGVLQLGATMGSHGRSRRPVGGMMKMANAAADRGTILLVEDNLEDVHMVMRRLRGSGYDVRHVRTGKEALGAVLRDAYVAVLLDHRLPDMWGTEICRSMVDAGVSAPVIVYSSLEDERLARQALAAGAADFLSKDITMANLAAFLEMRIQR